MTQEFPDRVSGTDENLWLEEIHGQEPLGWVKEQNKRTLELYDRDQLVATKGRLLEVYDSDERIPMVSKKGEWLYNFWQNAEHPRGLWRRTTLESYRSSEPDWETVIDVDALGKAEGTDWVWAGATFRKPNYLRALVELSPDGGDAGEIREFDLETLSFVEGGFQIPTAKTNVSWINDDTIFVGSDFGEGTLTTSGYNRQVRRWQRGTDIQDAEVVLEVDVDHMIGYGMRDQTPGFERSLLIDTTDFFNRKYYVLVEDDQQIAIDVPTDATINLHREWLTVEPKSDWEIGGTVYLAGSLLAIGFDAFMGGDRDFQILFAPDAKTSLQSARWTRNHLILNLIQDVDSKIRIVTPGDGAWESRTLETPELQSTKVIPVDEDDSDDYWMMSSGFLQPSTLSLGDLREDSPAEQIKSAPAMFDADGLHVEQRFATSKDGTRVPYFQISKKDLVLDGSNPTIQYGYGGFEISLTPAYNAATGRAWLEDGGVYVIANIRGGGEYGPTWHTSAMRENRHRAYEDFAAVAQDLIDRGVTSPEHLGCMGGSNGGLLVGNMLTHYPELFGAIVCSVPLLDMQRYVYLNAGASWIAEYGNPEDPDDWKFIQTFSPYHNLREDVDYPPVLFYTATSDDRVGPVQARKMAARMQARGIDDVYFYENTQGGHAGGADNSERATMQAMSMEFLRHYLK